MELGHFGQTGGVIKLRGVAEMHRGDAEQPSQEPQRVAFKGAISHSAACLCVKYSHMAISLGESPSPFIIVY